MSPSNPTSNTELAIGEYNIDPTHSEIGFGVRHLGLSKVRGRFNTFSGTANITADQLASSVAVTVDLASVDTNNADRDNHLRSTDFFNIEAQPTMEFVSTSVTQSTITGELTINGISKLVTFEFEFHGVAIDGYDTTRAGFSASTVIQRSDFGIDFNAPLGLDGMLIGDKITVELEIQLVPAS